jgi:LCP family protein required for cell wall assembly
MALCSEEREPLATHDSYARSKPYTTYGGGRVPRAFLAGALSAVAPGTGQIYAGRVRRGLVMLAIATAIAASVLVLWSQGPVFVLRLLVQPDVVLGLLVAVGAAFAFHVHCAVDAYKIARQKRLAAGAPKGRVSGRVAAIALLVGILALPYAAAAYYDYRSHDLLVSVFAEEEPLDYELAPEPAPAEPVPAEPAPGEPPPEPIVPLEPETTAEEPGTTAEEPGTTTEEPREEQPPEAASYWKERGRLNLLLVGGDAGPGRWGLRTDTMIVVSVNPNTGRTALFGVPRNLQHVPFPKSAHTDLETFPDILNALWGYSEARPELFPGAKRPGPTALKETIGNLLGLRIDYYAAVDLRGFVEMIDALGGVTVNVQKRVWDAGVSPPYEGEPWIVVDLQPGKVHMDGRLALGYARTRWATSDYDRMQRQRCLVRSLAAQANAPKLLRGFPKLASAIKKFVETDIPLKALPDLVELVSELDTRHMVGVSFVPPRFSTVYPDVEEMRATVQDALRRRSGEETSVEELAGSCG